MILLVDTKLLAYKYFSYTEPIEESRSLLELLEDFIGISNDISAISMEDITKKLTEDLTNMLYDFKDAEIKDTAINKASEELMLEVSDIRLNITALMITINTTYKIIGKDVINLATKIKEIELPNDFSSKVRKAYKMG